MEVIHLAIGHADTLGSIAILGSLLFAAIELRHVGQAQRVTNQLSITRQHREIWSQLFRYPKLKRVLDPKADITKHPVTTEETLFVTSVFLHVDAVLKAGRARMFIPAKALPKDIASFFSLPIPQAVWKKSRALQDADFVAFVETALVNPDHQ